MRWPRSVGSRRRVGATPLQRRPISKERSAAFLDTHTQIPLQPWGTAKYTQGTRRSFAPSANHLLQTTSLNFAPTGRFDPRLYPSKNAIFAHFGVIFGRFQASFRPAWGQTDRFLDTFGADLGNVAAFWSIFEGLNHLGSPQNTEISRLRTDLTPGFTPRKMPFLVILGPFWPISTIWAHFGPKKV